MNLPEAVKMFNESYARKNARLVDSATHAFIVEQIKLLESKGEDPFQYEVQFITGDVEYIDGGGRITNRLRISKIKPSRTHHLTAVNEGILEDANETFAIKNAEKFSKGVQEHGGTLTDHTPEWYLNNIEEEIIDLWNYLYALRERHTQHAGEAFMRTVQSHYGECPQELLESFLVMLKENN